MPRYPEELIEEVRSRTDIVDVISRYVQLKKKGSSYFGLCPFHNEKSPSFSVSRDKQMFYCFGCGVGGNVFTFLTNYENLTFPEAVAELAKECGVTLPEREETSEDRARNRRRDRMFQLQKDAATFYFSVQKTAKERSIISNREDFLMKLCRSLGSAPQMPMGKIFTSF